MALLRKTAMLLPLKTAEAILKLILWNVGSNTINYEDDRLLTTIIAVKLMFKMTSTKMLRKDLASYFLRKCPIS